MNREPVNMPLATAREIEELIEELIQPEHADRHAHILRTVLTSVADFEDPEKARLADVVLQTVYRHTSHCHRAQKKGFGEFVADWLPAPRPGEKEKSDQSPVTG